MSLLSLESISNWAASSLKHHITIWKRTWSMTNKSGCFFKPSSRFSLQLCQACRTSTSNRIPVLGLFIFNRVCALGAISYSAHPLNCEGLTKTLRLSADSPVPQERVTIKIHFGDSLLIAVDVLWGYAAQGTTERNVNAIVWCLNFNPLSTQRSLDGGFADIFPFM